jgi:CubicO group peptidase (beta-lactamase class C family)
VRIGRYGCTLHLLAVTSAAAQQPEHAPAEFPTRLRAAVTEHMEARKIPGLSLAVGLNGRVVFAQGFGLADLEHGVPVTATTLFGTHSTQKLLTATVVLRLTESGKLRLDDPVQAYCPEFGSRHWKVTARELLSHQAGLRASDLEDLFNRRHYASSSEALRRFVRDSLRYEPGTRVEYSNAGYTLLACAIEGATGRSYDSALADLVLRPAGMRATRADNVFEVIRGRARYYFVRTASNTEQWRGLWTAAHLSATRLDQPANADPVDPSWAIGAGSYLGTPSDLVRFALALIEGRLVGGALLESVFAEVSLTATGEPTGRTLGGWVTDPDGGRVYRVLGSSWNGSFGLAVDPAAGLAVAVASNIEFDQPADLVAQVLELWRPRPRGGSRRPSANPKAGAPRP